MDGEARSMFRTDYYFSESWAHNFWALFDQAVMPWQADGFHGLEDGKLPARSNGGNASRGLEAKPH